MHLKHSSEFKSIKYMMLEDSSAKRRRPRYLRRGISCSVVLLLGLVVFLSVYLTQHNLQPRSEDTKPAQQQSQPAINSTLLKERREKVSEAFQHAWDGYTKHCFGKDTLHPVSNTCEDDFGGWGATAIDALSTAILLENEPAVLKILNHIATIDFRKLPSGTKMQTFEINIRHFAAMLSAHDLLEGPYKKLAKDPFLRQTLQQQMVVLGDGLSCAFRTPSGVPRDWVDPAACSTDASASTNFIAGVGTMILEFARLSDITGNQTYAQLAERAEAYLLDPKPAEMQAFPGLLGSYVSVHDGRLVNDHGSWGAMSDSYYEYLIKGYLYNSDKYKHFLDRWLLAVDSTIRSVGSHPYGHPEWTLLSTWNGEALTNSMESLSWFAGGNLILGGMVTKNKTIIDYGLSIADAAGQTYQMTVTGLGAEFVTWSTSCETTAEDACDPKDAIKIRDGRFRLRPEVLETWYYAYRATQNIKYLEWSWTAFENINKHCRTDTGFSALRNVNADDGGGKTDVQESFVFAEVMKYVWLILLDDENAAFHVQDSRTGKKNTWVFNTEAHPLQVAGSPK